MLLQPNCIIKCVCDYFHVTPEILQSKNRVASVNEARQIAMYLIRENCYNLSIGQVAQLFNRNHATCIHACNRIGGLVEVGDKIVTSELRDLRKMLESYQDIEIVDNLWY